MVASTVEAKGASELGSMPSTNRQLRRSFRTAHGIRSVRFSCDALVRHACGPLPHGSHRAVWRNWSLTPGRPSSRFLMVFLIQQSQNKDLREVAAFDTRLAERDQTSGPTKELLSIDEDRMPTSDCKANKLVDCS